MVVPVKVDTALPSVRLLVVGCLTPEVDVVGDGSLTRGLTGCLEGEVTPSVPVAGKTDVDTVVEGPLVVRPTLVALG